jgi:predicted DCC family thiol-disulfide oxidoreductase YuxK
VRVGRGRGASGSLAASASPRAGSPGRATPRGGPLAGDAAIVLYDGACGMCVDAAEKGRRWQRPGALRWVDNASAEGRAILRRHGLEGEADRSIVVVDSRGATTESAAAVRVARRLRWPWKAYAALWVVPKPVRDWVYRRIAARRIRTCALPGEAERSE